MSDVMARRRARVSLSHHTASSCDGAGVFANGLEGGQGGRLDRPRRTIPAWWRGRLGRRERGDFRRDVLVLLQHLPVRLQAAKKRGRNQRSAQEEMRSGVQRVERSGQVAAVDGRNGEGLERLEGLGVVPVVDDGRATLRGGPWTAKLWRVSSAEFGYGEEAEFDGGLARVEQQPEVGGRNARRLEQWFPPPRVGDEVVVARATVLVEVAPDAQRRAGEERFCGVGRGGSSRGGRLSQVVMPLANAQSRRMGAATSSAVQRDDGQTMAMRDGEDGAGGR